LLVPLPYLRRRLFQDQQPAYDVHDDDDDDDGVDDGLFDDDDGVDDGLFDDERITPGFEGDAYRNGGFGAEPVSAAAVADLKKATFRAGGDGAAADGC
ncbi:hypothetical protein EJB05_29521, partial [Eragrostis curvula]